MFSELTDWYSKDSGFYSGEEDLLSPEEFKEEYPKYEEMEFALMDNKGRIALDEIWEYARITIQENLMK